MISCLTAGYNPF